MKTLPVRLMPDASKWAELLAFGAPYLTEKLLVRKIARTEDEAERLFLEVKRYFLILDRVDDGLFYPMYSLRIDEVWHQFVLFTREYMRFGERFFGRYLHHAPSNGPSAGESGGGGRREATFEELAATYEVVFELQLPELWTDASAVSPDRRLIRGDAAGELTVRSAGDRAELVAEGPEGPRVLLRVDAWGEGALRFLARHDAFFVRELPAPLTDRDRVAVCRALVASKDLRVAP